MVYSKNNNVSKSCSSKNSLVSFATQNVPWTFSMQTAKFNEHCNLFSHSGHGGAYDKSDDKMSNPIFHSHQIDIKNEAFEWNFT